MKEEFKKLNPYIQLGIVVVLVIIAYNIYKEIKYWIEKPRVNRNNIPVIGIGDNGQIVQWDPDPLAKELSEKLEGWNMYTYPSTLQKVLDLQTDDQLKLLYNHYNSKYAKDYPTLTKLIENEFTGTSSSKTVGIYASVVSKLKGLGLN